MSNIIEVYDKNKNKVFWVDKDMEPHGDIKKAIEISRKIMKSHGNFDGDDNAVFLTLVEAEESE